VPTKQLWQKKMGDGTPELVTKRCGEAFGRLRVIKGLSRPQVLSRLYRDYPDGSVIEEITESWLERFENGRLVKVQRHTIIALCKAIRATPRELWNVLVASDRNALADDDGVASPAAEALIIFSAYLYDIPEVKDMLTSITKDKRVATMSREALFQLMADVLTIAVPEYRSEHRPSDIPAARSVSGETT